MRRCPENCAGHGSDRWPVGNVTPLVAPVPKPRPDDSKLADSIDSGEQGG
ncbi:hypothetical protein GGQ73_003506 [Rhizobium skierniewicense]|uniref:Uncharacterized protein n=1 Tax=Rhizobium skierniewicense TaxID=984260 RepID=A0A7W6G2V4_9HYPH|nr:hypothetical protein [Rhizobium skierniewicense]